MRLIALDDKRELALKAVVYGCNTNKRLAGASFMTGIDSGSSETISFYAALSVIDEMMDDPIEAEPVKHGRWIDNIDDNGVQCNAWRKCSSCGGLNWSKKPPYCPNCGAKMDGDTHA